jgi:hypothetical protein
MKRSELLHPQISYIICPAIPSPTPAIIPAAAIIVGLGAAFVVAPTIKVPPVVVSVPNWAQFEL